LSFILIYSGKKALEGALEWALEGALEWSLEGVLKGD
jgi:hypothetical protein